MAMDALAKRVWEYRFGKAVKAKDYCGAWITKGAHGQKGDQGWAIDHIIPKSLPGGTSELKNLRPLHWQNNAAKGDKLDGQWTCAVSARD